MIVMGHLFLHSENCFFYTTWPESKFTIAVAQPLDSMLFFVLADVRVIIFTDSLVHKACHIRLYDWSNNHNVWPIEWLTCREFPGAKIAQPIPLLILDSELWGSSYQLELGVSFSMFKRGHFRSTVYLFALLSNLSLLLNSDHHTLIYVMDIHPTLLNLLRCGICCEEKTNQKLLPCQHIFCSLCLSQLPLRRQCIKCPICKKVSYLFKPVCSPIHR